VEREQLEKNIISAIFTDKELIDTLIENANENYFRNDKCRKVFNWFVKRFTEEKKISLVQAKMSLDFDIGSIIKEDMMLLEFDEWLDTLHKLYSRDQIKLAAKEIYEISKENELDVDESISKAQEILFKHTNEFEQKKDDYYLREAMMQGYERFLIEKQQGKINGLRTYYPSIDNNIGGFKNGHLTILGGSTSMGKSALAISLANKLITQDHKVHYVTLEMNAEEIQDRLLLMNSNVKGKDYQRRKINDVQMKALDHARNYLSEYEDNMIISEKRGVTVEQVKANCRKIYKKLDTEIIIIDYLQRFRLKNKLSVNKEVGVIANSIRDLAGELDIPIILLSQLSRAAKGDKPKMRHLRDSGEIEEAADEIWFVYRPDYEKYEQMEREPDRQDAMIIHAKGRTTGTGVSHFYFYPDLTYWSDAYLEDRGEVDRREILKYKG